MSEPTPPVLADDLPGQARARLTEMRERKLFTSDLSVNEFVLVREAGFEPVGLVMGTSIYHVAPQTGLHQRQAGELEATTHALNHARTLAMNRMEEEAEALGADGVIGVRLTVNLALDPQRAKWQQYRVWKKWADETGFRRPVTSPPAGWFADWEKLALSQWTQWSQRNGWTQTPIPPWQQATSKASYQLGANTAEFIAVGTAIRHRTGEHYRNKHGKPFQSDLSGQDFWLLIRSGYRPVGFVMGNCVYYVPPALLQAPQKQSAELAAYTHALYDARELAIERLQDEAEELGAVGVVGVTVSEEQHSWRNTPVNVGNAALQTGEVIELFVIGTAVVPQDPGEAGRITPAALIISANDAPVSANQGEE